MGEDIPSIRNVGFGCKKNLKLIATRRNAIVHEADLDPVTHIKQSIDSQIVSDNTHFLEACGDAIDSLVS